MTAVPMLPDTAPFSPSQRAWLNGFFAGLFAPRASAPQTVATPAPAAEADEEMPWHDPALPMAERLKLAEGKPRERVLMAAMAQLDCGACGYLCKSYSEAIARGEEKDLTKCAPGGKETARKLKELVALGGTATTVKRTAVARPVADSARIDRFNPYPAPLVRCESLNQPGSTKDTRLVVFDISGGPLTYAPGDSLGVYPENCPDTVEWILGAMDASGTTKVPGPDGKMLPLREALLHRYVITKPSAELVEAMAKVATDANDAAELRAMLDDNGPGIPDGLEVFDFLRDYPSARPGLDEFIASLPAMQPRLYSISSSPRKHPGEVHLTVGVVRFLNCRGRQCKGVASSFLSERVHPGQKVRLFIQPSHGFKLPADGNAPVIMIGPGTGIAPFRAFLQERQATNATGRNWLFFGDQTRDFDFLYRDELEAHQKSGLLTRLETAFSRDQAEKIYVQYRMLQHAAELWQWLRDGAHLYVCGDAKRMANDVDAALKQIVAQQGRMSPDQAKAFVADLAKARRYQRDVY